MDPTQPHHSTHISTWGFKQCVQCDLLNEALNERRYARAEYGEQVNRLLDAANRG
jgi:hypothetical protein